MTRRELRKNLRDLSAGVATIGNGQLFSAATVPGLLGVIATPIVKL